MNFSKLLYSFFSTLIAIFFILLGIICLMIPWLPLAEQKSVLKRIENDLTEAFDKLLGYQKEFYLSASFREDRQVATI